MAPAEVMPAHLYHKPCFSEQIAKQRVAHFFIYRDLRDIVVSETFYLHTMARWHRMSRHFRDCPDTESRLLLSINGMPDLFPNEYPDIATRFQFYRPWIDDDGCLAIRFEDLIGENREDTLRQIAEFDQSIRGVQYDVSRFTADALNAMNPGKSHTFRSGTKEAWKEHFTPRVSEAFDRVAGDLVAQLEFDQPTGSGKPMHIDATRAAD